jgi:outer membrane protein assembly factor BamB
MRRSVPTLLSGLAVLVARVAFGDDWPQWRGPERSGISREMDLLDAWPAEGPGLLWTADDAGEGYSSVAVAGGRVFTMGNRSDGLEYVIAYDEASGKELWAAPNGRGFRNDRGNGPRGTPSVEGEWVYAEGASGELAALEAKTGRKRWGFNILEKFGGRNPGWGLSESPLIAGRLLIVTPGGKEASVVALEKESGDVVWRSPGDRAGYSSLIRARAAGVEQVIVFHSKAAAGIRLADGVPLWRYERASNSTANVATPLFHEDHVFVTSDYGTGCALLKLVPAGEGKVAAEEVYFNREMKNHHGGVVLVGGHVYGFSSSILTCMDFFTGKAAWRDRSVGKGSLVSAGGRLYCLSEDGVVGLVEATAEGYRERGRFRIGRERRPTWAHPVVAGGKLFLRKDDKILCYDIRNPQG